MRIVVTGAGGQLGNAVVEQFSSRAEVIPLDRAALDITDAEKVSAVVARERPDTIINCAAYNDVDGAEDNVAASLTNNAFAVLALARAAVGCGATLVHYSTDFVFDGLGSRPYTEHDEPAPASAYGSSKLLGEWFASEAPSHYVLRVESLFGGSQRRSSIDKIVAALRAGTPARVFVDRTVTPSYVCDVAEATWALLEGRLPSGLYHCVNTGVTTWLELATLVRELLASNVELVPVRTADVKLRARRPQYCALANEKLASVGINMPTWADAVERYVRSLGLAGC
ncbi:MAG TPA: dTDP-4-dehydrorhamnose reductase [Vicinamibacterales bacterium]